MLEFVFEVGFSDSVVRTIGIRQAGTYRTQQLQNVSETDVIYKVNNKIQGLPFEVKSDERLELNITKRIDLNKGQL